MAVFKKRSQLAGLGMLLFLATRGFSAEFLALGAGSALIPRGKPPVSVVSENLELTGIETPPCYEVGGDTETASAPDGFVPIGSEAPCVADPKRLVIRPAWRAVDAYTFSSPESAADLELALPLTTWKPFENSELVAPGTARVQAFLDGQELAAPRLSWIALPPDSLPPELEKNGRSLAFVWNTSLKAGKSSKVELRYDFEVEYFESHAEELTYSKGQAPWYMRRQGIESSSSSSEEAVKALGPVRRLRYFLTPLKLWGAVPPRRISLRVQLPRSLPENLVVSPGYAPYCIGRRLLQFELDQRFPEDFLLSYPKDPSLIGAMSSIAEWNNWRGGRDVALPQLTCDLNRRLRLDGAEDLQLKLQMSPCVVSCPPNAPASPKAAKP